jgi:endoglucanase
MKYLLLILTGILSARIALPASHLDKAYQQQPGGSLAAVNRLVPVPPDSMAPDPTGMRDITSVELARELAPGWNLGNSLDAIGGETAWGNPKITKKLIDSIKAAGFRSVRIPVAWSHFTNATTFTIDSTWMARVEQVVNYALKDSLYAIINEHWDNGWIQPTYAQQEYVQNRLAVMWRQIAVHFRDYDDHLLFAGMNEVMVNGDYGTPKKEYYTVHNSYIQTFVNAVRSTGGRNSYRHLVVQGFNTNIDHTASFLVIPQDATAHRLFIEVHYYDPYNFTINSNSTITQWGKNYTNAAKVETWANEAWADAQFQKMKTKFVDKGYGVLLGEYGAMARTQLGSAALNKEHAEYRRYYMEYITRSIVNHGLVPCYWDNGGTGNLGMGVFNRATGEKAYPEIIKAIMDAVYGSGTGLGRSPSSVNPVDFSVMQNYPNPFNASTNIGFSLPSRAHVSLKIYDLLGREVATLLAEELPAGNHFRQWHADQQASGVYLYRLQCGSYDVTRKFTLVQ